MLTFAWAGSMSGSAIQMLYNTSNIIHGRPLRTTLVFFFFFRTREARPTTRSVRQLDRQRLRGCRQRRCQNGTRSDAEARPRSTASHVLRYTGRHDPARGRHRSATRRTRTETPFVQSSNVSQVRFRAVLHNGCQAVGHLSTRYRVFPNNGGDEVVEQCREQSVTQPLLC